MLDTNLISDPIRNPHGKAAKQIAKRGEQNICTSILVAAEPRYGRQCRRIQTYSRPENTELAGLKHDPEKACPALDAGCEAVFPRDKRQERLRGDHA
jgi:hypothetical protein